MHLPKTRTMATYVLVTATLALIILALVKPDLFRSRGINYKSGKMQLYASRAPPTSTPPTSTQAAQPVVLDTLVPALVPSQARPAISDAVLFRDKEAIKDAAGNIVKNQVESPYDEMLQSRNNTNFAYTKRLTVQDSPRTVGNKAAAPKAPMSVTPTQNSNAQFDAYRKAVLINPRMIQDKEKNHRRAFENRVGAGAGVYDTVTRMMENTGVYERPESVINCTGVPLLGLDTEHPCFNKIQDSIYNEDHLRIAV